MPRHDLVRVRSARHPRFLALSALLAAGCASDVLEPAHGGLVHEPGLPSGGTTAVSGDAGSCAASGAGQALFSLRDRDQNNWSWLYGTAYEGPAAVERVDGQLVITFDEPSMAGRVFENLGSLGALREGQRLWMVLQGSPGPFAPSLNYVIARNDDRDGALLFAQYGVAPGSRPELVPEDPELLGFTLSVADGCSARTPSDHACFEHQLVTRLDVTVHADEPLELGDRSRAQIALDGEPYNFALGAAHRVTGGRATCTDVVPGTFLSFYVLALGP